MKRIITIITLLAASLSFCIGAYAADNSTVNGAGASFPYPLYSAWGFNYHKAGGAKLNYQSIGSGGGIRQIESRTVEFGASDKPLEPQEVEKNNLYQFPAVMGGVVLVVNIPGMKPAELRLDPEVLTKIYLGEIKYWNDPKLKAINGGVRLPNKKITVVHRSDGSGTTAIYTTYLSTVSPEWKSRVGSGTAVDWPTGIGGKGNEGVANYVGRIKYSIGYVEFAYAKQNRLTYTQLENSSGNFVSPSFATFKDAAASADFEASKNFYLWLVNAPGKNAWPIAGATFILLARENKAANMKVVKFYDWAYRNGDKTAERLIYVPLPDSLKNKIRDYWKSAGIY